MADMLVKLYTLPEVTPLLAELKKTGVEIRQAHPSEKHIIAEWVRQHFKESWAIACEVGIEQRPISCYIAIKKGQSHIPANGPYGLPSELLVGFACYDVASKGIFGPEGVSETYRGCGIGKALLLTCLYAMSAEQYAYAVIGKVGPTHFYAKTVGATIIEGSEPGFYRGLLTAI